MGEILCNFKKRLEFNFQPNQLSENHQADTSFYRVYRKLNQSLLVHGDQPIGPPNNDQRYCISLAPFDKPLLLTWVLVCHESQEKSQNLTKAMSIQESNF